MAKIPQFTSLDEAAEFWDKHDFEDFVDDTEPVSITVRIPRRMIFSPEECKTVIVLGAGASRHAGVPLLGKFREKLKEIIASASAPTSEERRILQDADCLFERYRCPDENIEALFSTISAGASLGSHDACNDRDTLADAIAMVAEFSRDPQPSEPYTNLLNSIASMEKLNDDKAIWVSVPGRAEGLPIYPVPAFVVSFNWDNVLELECVREFSERPNPNQLLLLSWLSGRERFSYGYSAEIEEDTVLKFVRCLRPHGSLTWGVCPVCHRARVFADDEAKAAGSFFQTITKASCNWHGGEETPKLQPCIIAPTWDKRTDTPDLQGIWAATAQALMQCQNLLVIGFSLPPSDANVNAMFRFALGRNQILQKVMVVDPSRESMKNWRGLVTDTPRNQPQWWYVGKRFEDSLPEIKAWLQPRLGCCDSEVRQ